MPNPQRGDLRLTVGFSTIEVMVKRDAQNNRALFTRQPQDPLLPIISNRGILDYGTLNPRQGVTITLDDFSQGLGAFIHEDGRYAIGSNVDCRRKGIVIPGPRVVADLTGIAANEKVVKRIVVGTDNWIITTTTVYRSTGGTGNWTEVGANGAAWTVGNPTDIVAFGTSGGQPIIAVAMGAATTFQYTVDNGADWTASTRVGNAKYANHFCAVSYTGTAGKVAYVRNPNELYLSADLLNGTAVTTSSTVGDSLNDEFNSIVEDNTGVLLMGKRRYLYSIDSAGKVYTVAGPYRHYATSDLGSFVGMPTKPGNANFENPVTIEGRIYYPIEEYRLLEYDHGTLTEGIQPSHVGPNIMRLHQPLTALSKVGSELWVALGNAAALHSTALAPGRTAVYINSLNNDGEIYSGRRKADGTWVWHGVLARATGVYIRYLWYDDTTSYLYMAKASQASVNVSQLRCFTTAASEPFSFLSGADVILNSGEWIVETGKMYMNQPNVIKTLRWFNAQARASSNGPLSAYYRTADDDTTEAYSLLATYTTTATAQTGTAFPPSIIFYGMRLVIRSVGGGVNTDYCFLYNFQLTYLLYPPRYDAITFVVEVGSRRTGRQHTGAPSTVSAAQLRAFLDSWKDVQTPATVVDTASGDSWSMDLDPVGYREEGIGSDKVFTIFAHEVR